MEIIFRNLLLNESGLPSHWIKWLRRTSSHFLLRGKSFPYHKLTRETSYLSQLQNMLDGYPDETRFHLINCASAHRLNENVNIMSSNVMVSDF